MKCKNTDQLLTFIKNKHPEAVITHPSGTQTKIDFSCGLVMNSFTTGTVNFQGNSYENHIASDLINVIEATNR